MTSSIDQPGMFQDAARVGTQIVDDVLSLVVTICLVGTCLLITPFFLGAYYWGRLVKREQPRKLRSLKSIKSKTKLQLN